MGSSDNFALVIWRVSKYWLNSYIVNILPFYLATTCVWKISLMLILSILGLHAVFHFQTKECLNYNQVYPISKGQLLRLGRFPPQLYVNYLLALYFFCNQKYYQMLLSKNSLVSDLVWWIQLVYFTYEILKRGQIDWLNFTLIMDSSYI